MNCSDAEPFLDQLATDSKGCVIPNEMALRMHVTSCALCRHSLRMRKQWDSQMSRAMNDVAVPNEMTKRLITLLKNELPLDATSLFPARPMARRMIRTIAVAFAGLGLFAALFWLTIMFPASGQLSAAHVTLLWEQKPELISSESEIHPRLPHGWNSLRTISSQEWKQVNLTDLRMTLAVKPFELRYRESEPEQGWLFVISKSQWTPAPASSLTHSRVQYSSNRVWIVWSEGDLVYILALSGSPQSLERMQRQMDGDRAVF